MNCILKILCSVCLINGAIAKVTYFHEQSYVELQPPDVTRETYFGFSMGYLKKRHTLVIGAPRYDKNGMVFQSSLENIFTSDRFVVCNETHIDLDKLAGDYSRELATDQNFFLGSSISVATDYFLTCAPLWRAKIENMTSVRLKYGTYGACFVITDEVKRMKGAFEQWPEFKKTEVNKKLGMASGGTGWSTLIDEANNITLISLSPFTMTTDIGYMNTALPLASMKFMNIFQMIKEYYKNIGTFTAGKFFENKVMTYAFSSRQKSLKGVVAFIQRPSEEKGLWEVPAKKVKKVTKYTPPLYIQALESETGSMFGAALCAADVNSDGLSDLLVGAPAQGLRDSLYYEAGAIHIFLGGKQEKMEETRRSILSTKSAAHFGRTIAVKDIDGDEISEIFVSAPFEDSGIGAVYVFNGQEIKDFIKNNEPNVEKKLSDFKLTQRIQNRKYQWFGYSLLPLPDLDDNGCSEFAVGAPKSGKVLIYRSIPFLLLNVTAVIDRDYVRQTDKKCSIHIKIDVQYPVKPKTISDVILVTMDVVGYGVSIDGDNSFELNIDKSRPSYEKDIDIKFSFDGPGVYNFGANVTLKINENEDFDNSRVLISPYSNTTVAVPINRQCKKEDCVPILWPNIKFSGGNKPYILGSSSSETVTVTILNKGDVTYDSCVKILIEGSEVLFINAEQDSAKWYQYMLPKPFENGLTETIEIKVDMRKQTNLDQKLVIKVGLFNICNRGNFSAQSEEKIPFVLSTKHIFIDGLPNYRNITDTEIMDPKTTHITDDHIYTVINNGSMIWKSIKAEIEIKKQKFINSYHLSTLQSVNCTEEEKEDIFLFSCNFDLIKFLKFVVTLNISKEMLKDNLDSGSLITSSNFVLKLLPTEDKKINGITTTFYYQIDVGLGQNMIFIIAIAVILSVIFLMALSFVLYKSGFFKRPEKTKLEELKHEERKQSIRRPHPSEFVLIPPSNQENVEENATNDERRPSSSIQETKEGRPTSGIQQSSEGCPKSRILDTSKERPKSKRQETIESCPTDVWQETIESCPTDVCLEMNESCPTNNWQESNECCPTNTWQETNEDVS